MKTHDITEYPTQIGGVTLHSFAGVGGGDAPLQQCVEMVRRRKAVLEAWKKCRHLVIDEISMVDGRFFEKLVRCG